MKAFVPKSSSLHSPMQSTHASLMKGGSKIFNECSSSLSKLQGQRQDLWLTEILGPRNQKLATEVDSIGRKRRPGSAPISVPLGAESANWRHLDSKNAPLFGDLGHRTRAPIWAKIEDVLVPFLRPKRLPLIAESKGAELNFLKLQFYPKSSKILQLSPSSGNIPETLIWAIKYMVLPGNWA